MADLGHLEKMGRELKCPICSPSHGSGDENAIFILHRSKRIHPRAALLFSPAITGAPSLPPPRTIRGRRLRPVRPSPPLNRAGNGFRSDRLLDRRGRWGVRWRALVRPGELLRDASDLRGELSGSIWRWLLSGSAGFEEKGDCCGIYGLNCPEWIIAMEACMCQRTTYVPLYDTLGPNTVEFIINHAEVSIAFTQENKIQSAS